MLELQEVSGPCTLNPKRLVLKIPCPNSFRVVGGLLPFWGLAVQGVRFVPSKGHLGFQGCWVLRTSGFEGDTQRAQYSLVKEYGLNYIGLHIMI